MMEFVFKIVVNTMFHYLYSSTDFNSQTRKYIEGILSFTKGCSLFDLWNRRNTVTGRSTSYLEQESANPSVYTKLSCFLPWIAEQYNMDYDSTSTDDDDECTTSIGNKNEIANNGECRSAWIPADSLNAQGGGNNGGERLCKFPFYWNGKLYDQCIMLDEDDMILPVFRCPIRDSQNKINGINAWTYEDLESQVSYTVVYSIRYSLLKDCTI